MSGTAFGKITAVYGQIDENWEFVRKWPARKIPITDKMVKNSCLSVKIQPFRTRIYGQMLRKAVFVRKSSSWWSKIYGQITEKYQFVRKMRFDYGQISKNGLFVRKFEWNLGVPPGIRKNPRHHGTNFNQYSVVRGHDRAAPHLHNRAQTSNKAHDKFVPRRDCACADHSRPSLSPALLSGWSSHLAKKSPFSSD